jgi:hypothetical protein
MNVADRIVTCEAERGIERIVNDAARHLVSDRPWGTGKLAKITDRIEQEVDEAVFWGVFDVVDLTVDDRIVEVARERRK